MQTSLSQALRGLALALLVLLLGGGSGSALAEPQGVTALQGAVDQYLHSLPADFHTLRTVPALKRQLAGGNTLLIDVRQPSEYRAGHILGAINIPLRELDDQLSDIPTDKEIVLYCSTGFRSAMGVMALHLRGYTHVRGFPPSFAGWQAAGEAVSSPDGSGTAQA
ncbi:rhodanese-like domain-containing protein [Cyanobium gracile UHCC 0139]|uniref:Rhodanese-like domain-containing protein n=1 Tax=Cyanobium gracile UHCC 0139 TaxID=3110308 RepID=A0ABU5RTZ8_9CYAN|nr:rhodanese-like domain-containing protein [Cyanobium gracile]MEA5391248.1 rhodanese-like domain-containing protein [Cyanobium gracile UHCC 0139]